MSPPLGVYFSPPDRVGTHLITVHFAQLSTENPFYILNTFKSFYALCMPYKQRVYSMIKLRLPTIKATFTYH